jgi:hypothetical protein
MKKIIGSISIVLMLLCLSQVVPAMENEIEKETQYEDDVLGWSLFAAVGIVNVNKQSNVIRGFVLVGFNAGEVISFQMVNIPFDGTPITLTNSIFTTICLYKVA